MEQHRCKTGEDNMKKKLFRINLFLLLIVVMLLGTSCGKNKATTMKLIKTDGDVGVENEKGKSVDLIENLGLYNGYGIGTQSKSFAWIDLDDTKLTKMDEKSDVDIKKDGKKLELVVNSGGLFFNVTKPLEDDESMDIRTSTTICGIRGTCGWVESRGDTTYVGVFDGKVECIVMVDGKEETVTVNAKELLIVKKDGDNVTYEIKKLTYKDVPEFVQLEIADEPFVLKEELSSVTARDFEGSYINQDTGTALSITALDDTRARIYWRDIAMPIPPDTPLIPIMEEDGVMDGDSMITALEYNAGKYSLILSGDQMIVTVLEPSRTGWATSDTDIDAFISGTYVLGEKEDVEERVDIKDYIGTFMNGQNIDAGKLTITEINSQSVNVRLEAFRTFDAQEVSVIFEEAGYPFENGIYVDVSGKRVEIKKQNFSINGHNYDGYILDVPEVLKKDWDIILNYEKEYVSIE